MSDVRPDRHTLLQLEALLSAIEALRDEGDAARSDPESRYRWILHRLRIAGGNKALAGSTANQDFGLAAWRITHMPTTVRHREGMFMCGREYRIAGEPRSRKASPFS